MHSFIQSIIWSKLHQSIQPSPWITSPNSWLYLLSLLPLLSFIWNLAAFQHQHLLSPLQLFKQGLKTYLLISASPSPFPCLLCLLCFPYKPGCFLNCCEPSGRICSFKNISIASCLAACPHLLLLFRNRSGPSFLSGFSILKVNSSPAAKYL